MSFTVTAACYICICLRACCFCRSWCSAGTSSGPSGTFPTAGFGTLPTQPPPPPPLSPPPAAAAANTTATTAVQEVLKHNHRHQHRRRHAGWKVVQNASLHRFGHPQPISPAVVGPTTGIPGFFRIGSRPTIVSPDNGIRGCSTAAVLMFSVRRFLSLFSHPRRSGGENRLFPTLGFLCSLENWIRPAA